MTKERQNIKPQRALRNARANLNTKNYFFNMLCALIGFWGNGKKVKALLVEGTEVEAISRMLISVRIKKFSVDSVVSFDTPF